MTDYFSGQLADYYTGATIKHLTGQDLARYRFPLPSIPEQRGIAAILDNADALRAKRRAALAQLDNLTRSIFLDMFGDPATNPKGWPIANLGDLLESAAYGTSKKASTSGSMPVLRMNNVTVEGRLDLSDLKFMDLAENERERYSVRNGDLLFNRTNSAELVGKTGIFRESQPMAYAGYLIRLRPNRASDPEYLNAFMNTPYAKRVLRSMCKSIIGMANINATEVQAMRIAKPPIALQQKFALLVTDVEKLRITQQAAFAKTHSLFAAVQHHAFRGEL